jgi:hypothetical protein
MALVLGDGIQMTSAGWTSWSNTLESSVALGPLPSRTHAAQSVSIALEDISVGTRSLYLGANRGRGQLYPDGSISNLSLRKTEVFEEVRQCGPHRPSGWCLVGTSSAGTGHRTHHWSTHALSLGVTPSPYSESRRIRSRGGGSINPSTIQPEALHRAHAAHTSHSTPTSEQEEAVRKDLPLVRGEK